SSTTSSNTHKPVTDSNACTLDGNKFAVGDTVTCVYKLYAPEVLENYQGYISYDTKYLSVKSAKLDGPAKSSGFLNYNLNGKIKFNGSNISTGYDYTNTGSFIVVNYEIKAAGSTTPKFVWEVATGESEKAYVENNKAVNGLKLTKEYS
ncbi:MAG: cohesin domain-containing protein, partial [Ruminococcus sp.]